MTTYRILAEGSRSSSGYRIGVAASRPVWEGPGEVAYTAVGDTLASGETVRALIPDTYDAAFPTTMVIYCHGAGGDRTHMTFGSSDAVTRRMLSQGWIVAASDMHGDNWGNQDSIDDLVDLEAWVRSRWSVKNVAVWSASMGGLAGLSALGMGVLTDVIGWVGSSPCCSLAWNYNDATKTEGVKTAYGIAADGSDYGAQTSGYDPLLRSAADFADTRLRWFASPSDTTVDKTENSDAMQTHVASEAFDATVVEASGGHSDASNYPPQDIVDWLLSSGAVVGGDGTV